MAVAPIDHPRAAQLAYLQTCLSKNVSPDRIHQHADLPTALRTAYKNAAKNDKIIVFGSFFTVAAILELTPDQWAL